MLGVQHQRKVQHAGFELGKRAVRAQHLQNIFCGGKLGLRRADDQRFVVMGDVVYKTEKAKFNAVIDQIAESHEKGQPVLVGTISIEKSELLSTLLKRRGIRHEVLNAKYHEKEAEIVAQAGKFGVVTIATNMAIILPTTRRCAAAPCVTA